MRGKYKAYLFERLENYGTKEVKDVFTLLDNNTYSIEHIMPQHLTSEWQESLGPDYQEIHSEWLHRLANLTLTAYNPNLSNKTFAEKRDSENGGYKTSGIRMNQLIAQNDNWGIKELIERNEQLLKKALEIWSYPPTEYVPPVKEYESCTLDDEEIDLTGRELAKYSYKNAEIPVNSWAEMLEQVVSLLHQQDKSVLTGIAFGTDTENELSSFVKKDKDKLRGPLQIDENIYIERNTSTAYKCNILRKLFALYHADPMDLVFYLKDQENDNASDEGRKELRKRYWDYALPIIKEENKDTGCFSKSSGGPYNTVSGFFGIGGFNVSCVANYSESRVDLWLGSNKQSKNKAAFDVIYKHKEEIEKEIGENLVWDRADEYKASWVYSSLKGVGIINEGNWERIAEFHAKTSKKFVDVFLPYLKENEK
ncbi:MAG: DUF4268 domain-containing protein [Erysipelotrichaceae bacterium]|nr:DUF4268 domain-containing protein [Erysipelotrichaceae bacterium]